MYIFLSGNSLGDEEGYKDYLKITPGCFNKLFVLVNLGQYYKINYKHERCKLNVSYLLYAIHEINLTMY